MYNISKQDKKDWVNYISDLDGYTIKTKNNFTHNIYKNSKSINQFKVSPRQKLLRTGKIKPDIIIDLHGHTLQTAKIKLQKIILYAYENNLRNLLVITGKGINKTGVLKREVPIWLNQQIAKKYIINNEIAPKILGGEGALLLRVKNKNKNLL